MGIDTARLRELAEAATPGPWCVEHGRVYSGDTEVAAMPGSRSWWHDADFIAAANPAAILRLLDALNEAEDRADLLRDEVGRVTRSRDEWEANAGGALRAMDEHNCHQQAERAFQRAAAAEAAIARVRERHRRRPWDFLRDSQTFGQTKFPDRCDACRTPWPCPTICALEGVES